jgi:hypothetical protein
MKKWLFFTLVLLTALWPLACGKKTDNSLKRSTETPTATAILITCTPTITMTPVCGFILVQMPGTPVGADNTSPTVLRNMSDWSDFYSMRNGEPTPVTPSPPPNPPVDFKKQMLIVILKFDCPLSILSLTSVCETTGGVTINMDSRDVCELCEPKSKLAQAIAFAVPQSNQAITWNVNRLSCKNPALKNF